MTTPYTVDELRERIRTLENGLTQVAKGIQFADRGVTYHDADELRKRIAYFEDLLAGLLAPNATVPARSKQTLGASSKGF